MVIINEQKTKKQDLHEYVISTPYIQGLKLKNYLCYFGSSEFIIGLLSGIGCWFVTWRIAYQAQNLYKYFLSSESILSWLVLIISCLISFIIMAIRTFNRHIRMIQRVLADLATSPQFNPEDSDILHKFNGLIAITNAKPNEWFTPFFYFYLINNGLVTLKWRNDPICTVNRTDRCTNKPYFSFLDKNIHPPDIYQQERNDIIDSLKNGTLDILNLKKTIRFMFIKEQDFRALQCNIACLYAIHDLFGAHLFVLKESLMSQKNVKDELIALKKSCGYESSGNLFDVAFGVKNHNGNSTISALYINKSTNNIEEFPDANLDLLAKLLKIIATKVKDERYELMPKPENSTKYHFTVNKGT